MRRSFLNMLNQLCDRGVTALSSSVSVDTTTIGRAICPCLPLSGFKSYISAAHQRSAAPGTSRQRGTQHSSARCLHTTTQAAYTQAPAASSSASHRNTPAAGSQDEAKFKALRRLLLDNHDIDIGYRMVYDHWYRTECPSCQGGSMGEDSFGVLISRDHAASWRCHRATCGFRGSFALMDAVRTLQRSKASSGASAPSSTNGNGSPHANGNGGSRVGVPQQQVAPAPPGAAQQAAAAASPESQQDITSLLAELGMQQLTQKRTPVRPNPSLQPLNDHPQLLQWFSSRGISPAALELAGAMVEVQQGRPLVAFPQRLQQQLVNVAYLDLGLCGDSLGVPPGASWQVPGAAQALLGYDSAMAYLSDPATPDMDKGCLLVAVGELDLLAFYQIGIRNVVALPSSSMHQHAESMAATAPAAGTAAPSSPPSSSPSSALAALDSCTELLDSDKFPQITIAPPNTQTGFALGEELARRLGKERCYRLVWPSSPQDNPRLMELADAWPQAVAQQADAAQDAAGEASVASDADASQVGSAAAEAGQQQEASSSSSSSSSSSMAIEPPLLRHPVSPDPGYRMGALEVLAYDGAMFLQYLRDVNTVEYPVQGLHSFADFWGEIYEYYMQQRPYETGVSSGWEALDQYYRVVPGELTVVTGVPNSGKSEWLDALLVNLSRDNNWSFAMCSFEKSVTHHARQLLEKYFEKPFWPVPELPGMHLSRGEVLLGLDWLSGRFHLIRFDDNTMPSIDDILDKARIAVLRYGIRGLVVDPYNELSHERPGHVSETEYVSQMLSKVKRFAQLYECHVWFVAHPRQLHDWQNRAPNLYDISGSAHFINKADNGVVVHRDWEGMSRGEPSPNVQVLIRKVRNKAAGKVGEVVLRYDRGAGVYRNVPQDQQGSL